MHHSLDVCNSRHESSLNVLLFFISRSHLQLWSPEKHVNVREIIKVSEERSRFARFHLGSSLAEQCPLASVFSSLQTSCHHFPDCSVSSGTLHCVKTLSALMFSSKPWFVVVFWRLHMFLFLSFSHNSDTPPYIRSLRDTVFYPTMRSVVG